VQEKVLLTMPPVVAPGLATSRARGRGHGRKVVTVDERTRRFALAAGAVGMLANLLLIGFYALELGREPIAGVSLGSLNDLTGAVGTALMIPVALAFGPAWLRALGITAMTVGTVGGLLLVFDVLTFEQQLPIVLAAFVALALWMLLTARQLTGARRRLGVPAAAGVLVGMPVVGLGLLFPPLSWPQLALFGAGALVALPAWLAMPVWFLLLGRREGGPQAAEPPSRRSRARQ
jgi:hypothetical protein